MYKSGICDSKPVISLKQSSLEPKLLQSVYRNSYMAYRLVMNLVTYGELWRTFLGSKSFSISRTLFVRAQQNLAILGVCLIETYSPNSINLFRGSCDTMRQQCATCISPSLMHL